MVRFVSTVGTSALNNLATAIERDEVSANLDPETVRRAARDEKAIEELDTDELLEALLEHLRSDPTRASAELNTLLRMKKKAEKEGLHVEDVALIPTKTENCRLCTEAIRRYLIEEEGIKAWTTDFVEASVNDPNRFWEGLNQLIARLETAGVTEPHREVWVAASAGFKPETAVLTLVASLFGKPVFYVHEVMRELVEIPPIAPAVTDPKFVLGLLELEEKLGNGADIRKAREILESIADTTDELQRYRMFLVKTGKNTVKPSPLARLAIDLLSLGLAAAGSRRYDVRIKAKGHTVPRRRGKGVEKAHEVTLAELPVENDTRDTLATIAALEDVNDTWFIAGEWTTQNTSRHHPPVKVLEKKHDAVIVSVRDSRVHISRLSIPTRNSTLVAKAVKHLSQALRG